MARAQDLINDGRKLYKAGEYRAATLCWAEAASAAAAGGDVVKQHEALVWQGEAFFLLGETTQTLSRLLAAYEVESENPAAPFTWLNLWIHREMFARCLISGASPLTKIRDAMAELTVFATSHRVPPQDIAVIQGDLLTNQGRWAEALSQYETALAQHSLDGYAQCGLATEAVISCIRLQRWAAVEDWIAAIRNEGEWERGFAGWISIAQGVARFALARARGEGYARLRQLILPIEAVSASVDAFSERRRQARLTLALLDPHGDDPAHGGHPARRALAHRPNGREEPHTAFDYVKAILDYRLACLRFAAGVPPVDDEYHEAPPPPPLRIANPQDFLHRLQRARAALAAVRRRACKIDTAFECDWRQQDIDRRARAIEAIAQAYAQ